jgi:hypothetical protein
MSRYTWNKAQVPTNGDTYDVPAAIGKAIETSGLVIGVMSQSERDSIAAAYGATTEAGTPIIPPGCCVVRLDVPGAPIERWDGTQWRRSLRVNIGQGANDPSHAAGVSVVTTNANGDATIDFPVPFGSVLSSAVITDANDPTILGAIILKLTLGSSDRTKLTFRAYTTAGTALANQSIALSWMADGY